MDKKLNQLFYFIDCQKPALGNTLQVWYGILEFNVPVDTV